jgi:hypothetical protein
MSKYQFGMILLLAAGMQFFLAMKIARLNRRKSSDNADSIDAEIKRLNRFSKCIQLGCPGGVLMALYVGYRG